MGWASRSNQHRRRVMAAIDGVRAKVAAGAELTPLDYFILSIAGPRVREYIGYHETATDVQQAPLSE